MLRHVALPVSNSTLLSLSSLCCLAVPRDVHVQLSFVRIETQGQLQMWKLKSKSEKGENDVPFQLSLVRI